MADRDDDGRRVSSGVEALIEQLHREGVEAGQRRAEAIVADAEARAGNMVAQAREEAARIEAEAHRKIDRERQAATEAVRTAVRDAMLDLRGQLSGRFADSLRALVAEALTDRALLERVIVELAGRVREEVGDAEATMYLPREAVGFEELTRDPDALAGSRLTELVRGLSAEMLRDGVTLALGAPNQRGVRIVLADGSADLEFSEETVTAMLLAHLQPRFRALVEGVVR